MGQEQKIYSFLSKPHKTYLGRQIRARPRLFIAAGIGVLTIWVLPQAWAVQGVTRLIISWNVGACLYLLLSAVMMARSTPGQICHRARLQDEGRWLILILVIIAAAASLAAIVAELAVAKDMHGTQRALHISLAAFTILSSWAFTHVMFALHYAHDFYSARTNKRSEGLEFPNDDTPDYGDFIYFSFVIGTSGQTADVNFTSKPMRRIGAMHCVLAFVFNTTVLALTINIAASMF